MGHSLPPLLSLLFVGMATGGRGPGRVDASSLGAGRGGRVALLIAVRIYEGSLWLDRDPLRQASRVVRGLLTTGASVGGQSVVIRPVPLLQAA